MFQGTQLDGKPGMPGKPMIMNMLSKLKDAGVLKVLVHGRGATRPGLGVEPAHQSVQRQKSDVTGVGTS